MISSSFVVTKEFIIESSKSFFGRNPFVNDNKQICSVLNNINLLEIQCSDVYFIYVRKSTEKYIQLSCIDYEQFKIFQIQKLLKDQQQKSPFSLKKKNVKNKIHFPTPEEEEVVFKILLEEHISSFLKVKTTTQRASVRMIQNKHPLKCVQEYLGMAREITIDKENLTI
ncbi:hypothetical protein RFI_25278 [Reticulomyxa filosa]|uniref:Uncharacterized protein n=1 Tax=Reticulomyxa filosa TaxID=46433 RepID=X6MDK2_RETFI|nr:hypothetical protein RFI_25278 [Reticulomyxa filosa]|eukprot:ETO12098.1 hypothetical protein RFI_25278 [Reticulomyxa filosa]